MQDAETNPHRPPELSHGNKTIPNCTSEPGTTHTPGADAEDGVPSPHRELGTLRAPSLILVEPAPPPDPDVSRSPGSSRQDAEPPLRQEAVSPRVPSPMLIEPAPPPEPWATRSPGSGLEVASPFSHVRPEPSPPVRSSVLAEPDLVTPADPNATSSLYSRGINHAADSLSPRLAAHLASHLGPYVPGNHAIQSVLVASGFHCLDVFATLRTGVGDDDDLANLEDEVRREVVAHGTYCGIRDPGWRLKVGQRRTIQFAVNAATEAARASARPEKGVGEVEGRARAARKRALGSVPEEDEEAESSAEAPRALESPPQRSPLRRPSVRRRSVPEIGQDTDAVACRVAYRSGGGGGSAGKVHALADVSLDSELRNRLLNVLRECLESRRLPWVAGRDYSLVFSISPRPGAGKWERGVGAGPSASVVCKCGTSLKLWYPNAEKRLKMSTFLRHLKERCSAVKSEMVAVHVDK